MIDAADVRPLGIGEILDRAVHVYVRWFGRFFVALALLTGPLLAAEMIVEPGSAASTLPDVSAIVKAIQSPGSWIRAVATPAKPKPLPHAAFNLTIVFVGILAGLLQMSAALGIKA